MTYQETMDWLFVQLPMYQNQGKKAFKKDLTNSIALAKYLGNPEEKFPSIHVGGTNGKGSTSHMIASVLQEAGYKTKHANKEAIDVKFNRLVPKNKETPSTPSYRLRPRRRLSWEFSLKDLKVR